MTAFSDGSTCGTGMRDLSIHSQAKLIAVARQLNERPRNALNFDLPDVSTPMLRQSVSTAAGIGFRKLVGAGGDNLLMYASLRLARQETDIRAGCH